MMQLIKRFGTEAKSKLVFVSNLSHYALKMNLMYQKLSQKFKFSNFLPRALGGVRFRRRSYLQWKNFAHGCSRKLFSRTRRAPFCLSLFSACHNNFSQLKFLEFLDKKCISIKLDNFQK